MTPTEAAWVRENVWTAAMRKTHRDVPGDLAACACQYGLSGHCRNGDCERCPRGVPLPSPIGYVCRRGGEVPAVFAGSYEHPHATATGRVATSLATVWYADRLCRWLCPCDCHRRTHGEQRALFEAVSA